MNDSQRYKIIEHMKRDKQQKIFGNFGIEKNNSRLAEEQIEIKDQKVFCPFCLYKDDLSKFAISNKKGLSRRYAKCPECSTIMLLETPLRLLKMNAPQFALWVYDYPAKLFWSKCSFEKWKKRLYLYNMSKPFWDRYKELRASSRDLEEN